jgi:hypothetical protein
LTFAKPNFDGLRLDWATDYYQGSVLFSRPSAPAGGEHSHATHLMGGHLEVPLGGQGRLGLTYVNAHNAQTQVALTRGNLLHGVLTTPQQQAPQTLWVRLRDDSPEDNRSGATLYRHEIVLVDSLGVAHWGGAIGLLPRVEGGAQIGGALTATGAETILLEYDLSRLRSYGLDPGEVSRVGVELQVANDYHVEMASTLQQAGQTQNPETVFFTVARAPGNVADATNARVLFLDYGLPTANAILGIDGEWTPLPGLSLRGELALNRHYARYPGPQPARNFERITQAEAGYLVLSWDLFPWSLFAETFSIDDAYTTSHWLVQGNGEVRFRAPIPDQYEFVDDDDDYNNIPEWERPFQPSSRQVAWPGYDENGDFLFDHNQNDNLVPDYEEPFLRFRSDRPEFLFGLDMNHNHTIDRFENDLLPDYPYRRDHRGYNAYLSAQLGPEARLLAGHQRLGLMAGSGRTRAWYLLGTLIRDQPGLGRLQLADFAALVRDDIPDDLQQWVQPVGSLGRMREAPDELAFQHTLSNVLYADMEQMPVSGLRLFHRCKWEWLRQRDRAAALAQRQGRRRAGFLGLINKAEWSLPLGLATLQPRWKSEYRRDRPFDRRRPLAESLEQTFIVLWTQPLLAERTRVSYHAHYGRQLFDTQLQVGAELGRFWMLEGQREEIDQDFWSWVMAAQLTNRVAYQGYQLVTRAGLQWRQRRFARAEDQRDTMFFMTMHAGLR